MGVVIGIAIIIWIFYKIVDSFSLEIREETDRLLNKMYCELKSQNRAVTEVPHGFIYKTNCGDEINDAEIQITTEKVDYINEIFVSEGRKDKYGLLFSTIIFLSDTTDIEKINAMIDLSKSLNFFARMCDKSRTTPFTTNVLEVDNKHYLQRSHFISLNEDDLKKMKNLVEKFGAYSYINVLISSLEDDYSKFSKDYNKFKIGEY